MKTPRMAAVALLLVSCTPVSPLELYLGPPGTSETHAVVEVRAEHLDAAVWRLRSVVDVDGHHGEKRLPERKPSSPLTFPASYTVVAKGRSGVLSVLVEALDGDGRAVGRGRGSAELVTQDSVHISVELGRACAADADCDDALFCNGAESCQDGVCAAGAAACPPSVYACVEVSCVEAEARCSTATHDEHCPSVMVADGWSEKAYCDRGAGCVPGQAGAPRLADTPTVTPALGRLGTRFLLQFTASEPLAADPVVQVDVGTRRAGMTLDEASTQRPLHHYAYVYDADGSEHPGAAAITLGLLDFSGTTAEGLSGGSFALDFTPPALRRAQLDRAALREGAAAVLTVEFSEGAAGAPRAWMTPPGAGPEDGAVAWVPGEPAGTYRYQAAGTEREGDWSVWVAAEDVAGNASGPLAAGRVTLDFTDPAVRADPPVAIQPGRARAGQTVTVELWTAEPVAASAQLRGRAAGLPDLVLAPASGAVDAWVQQLTFLRGIQEGQDGDYTLVLSGLQDAAGNRAPEQEVGLLHVDTQVPHIVNLIASPARLSAQPGFNQLVVTLDVAESLDQPPAQLQLSVEGVPVTCGTYQLQPPHYTCMGSVTGQPGQDGSRRVLVVATDAAGNGDTASTAVDVDFTAPALRSTTVNPALARLGDTVSYAVTASEPLQDVPEVAAGGAGGLVLQYLAGTTYTFQYRVADGQADGTHAVTLGLVDLVGNRSAGLPGSPIRVDGTPPVVTVRTDRLVYSAREPYNLATLMVDASESLDVPGATLEVTLEGSTVRCGSYQPQAPHYTCTAPISGQPGEDGVRRLQVVARDAAGNTGVASTSVAVDFTAPAVLPGALVQLLAPEGCALTRVAAATAGAMLRAAFALTESVPEPPEVATATPETLVFSREGAAGALHVYTHTLQGLEHAQGRYTVAVTARDSVGNQGTSLLDGDGQVFTVDTHAPGLPDVAADGGVLYQRQPWGGADGVKHFWVEGPAGSVEPGTVVRVVDQPDARSGAELGRGTSDGAGAFRVDLQPADRLVVYLSAVDGACNQSDTVDVKEVAWTASLNGKVAGSVFENPHAVETRAWFQRGRYDPAARELAGTPLGRVGGERLETASATAWRRRDLQGLVPPPRAGGAMAYDSVRERLVLTAGSVDEDFWEWDGSNWLPQVLLDPEGDGSPGGRDYTSMAFDPVRARMVLFGGWVAGTSAETWEHDGTTWARRTPLDPEGDGDPLGREMHAMVYDSARGVVVAFGGWSMELTRGVGDTWEWDGSSWTLVAPEDAAGIQAPAPRVGCSMAYDPHRGRSVLFGGVDNAYALLGDTWEWDGHQWQVRTPAEGAPSPSPRSELGMATAATLSSVLLFGGKTAAGLDGETWEWDGTGWTLRVPPDPEGDGNPSPRKRVFMALDGARGVVVLFGGRDASGNTRETWRWDGTSWARRTPGDPEGDGVPAPRFWPGVAYDSARDKVVLFGGGDMGGNNGETWEWDGASWARRIPEDPEHDGDPSPRWSMGTAYDSARGRTVVFGGGNAGYANGETWEWDGVSWAQRSSTGPDGPPAPRFWHSMAYDSRRQRTVMYGGSVSGVVSGETWEWDGESWYLRVPDDGVSPAPRQMAAMAFDSARGRIVMVDSETWEWDGAHWTLCVPTDPEGDGNPGPRGYHALAFDSLRGKSVLFGGDGQDANGETWEWDGVSWARSVPATVAGEGTGTPRYRHGLVFDSARGQLVAVGGDDGGWGALGPERFTEVLERGATARPGHVARFAFAAAGVQAGVTLTSVSSTWYAGGRGLLDGAAGNGATGWVWDRGTFLPVASNAAGGSSPAVLRWSTADPAQVLRLFQGARQEVTVAVTPAGFFGTPGAGLVSDYVELQVRYRRP